MPGCSARNVAKIGGSTSQPMISLAVTRTTPRSAAASPDAARASAAAAAAIASTCGAERQRRWRRRRPRGERVNSGKPERGLQRVDMPADRRLRQAEPPRGAGQAAVAQHLEEGAQFVPSAARAGSYENV